jgi:predicted enzyme related to lactoylglutathione lyase
MAKTNKTSSKKESKQPDPVVHFEIPANDRKRMAKFYNAAFGWKAQMLGADMGNYTLVTTAAETDKKGRPKKKGVINGGFFEKDKKKPAQYPSVVIAVDDIKKSMAKITKSGGKVLGQPMEIPGFGSYVSFYDTEGNRVSIMEPTMQMKKKAKN